MPELSDDLNALFAAEASVQASPSRGVSELARAARGGRRRRQAGVAALAACGALVVGVAATVGAGAVGPGPAIPGQGGSPSPSLGSVTWDPEGAVADATAGFVMPTCGERWSSAAVSVAGVTPIGSGSYREAEGESEAVIEVTTAFVAGADPVQLLGDPLSYVLVKDGVVVGVSQSANLARSAYSLSQYTTGAESNSSIVLGPTQNCAAELEKDEVYAAAGFDPDELEPMTDEQWAEIEPELDAIAARYPTFDPGTYTIYVLSPVVFGEQLALAEEFAGLSPYGLGPLNWAIGETPLGDDPRIAPYCTTVDEVRSCDAPQDVLAEVFTFEVDPAAIVHEPSGVAISEPITVTVP